MTAITTIKDLRSRAMRGALRISVWEGRRFDAGLTKEVTESHGAAADTVRVNRHLFAPGVLAPITVIRSRARTWFNTKTLTWDEDGWRLLPASLHGEIAEAGRKYESEFAAAVRDWLDRYDDVVENERTRQNGMFNPALYPPRERVARRFRFRIEFEALSEARDLRIDLADDQTRAIRAAIERAGEERIERAMRDTWQRLYAPVAEMVEKLAEFDLPGKEKRQRVGQSINQNILDVIDLLPRLNVWGDPELARMAEQVRDRLTKTPPETFKDSPDARHKQIADAKAILAAMAGFVGEG